ncbi:MAG TPA: VWA domain-containing protein [Blastocatellia bacterium]|nr:VWA domain-containing protein [Blastocatellia bacterium]
MKKRTIAALLALLLSAPALSQEKPQKPTEEQPIRISTELVQVDVVVTDKNGRVVRGLTKDDFTLYEKGKKQAISFFEFVDAVKGQQPGNTAKKTDLPVESPQGLSESEVRRIFAFVIDDLTIRYEDLSYLKEMLLNFVNNQMQPTDLVAIVRTIGGKGLLQQFTTNKDLLRRAINSLMIGSHPLRAFNNPQEQRITSADLQPAGGGGEGGPGGSDTSGIIDTTGETIDIDNPQEDTNRLLRAYMSIGTASFVIDGLRQLPGRKSLVLISGGLPILSSRPGTAASNISNFINLLADRATRAGVAIHTLDIRGLQAHAGVASFDDTPGKSAMDMRAPSGFGRVPDESLMGDKNPFDTLEAHQGLRVLSSTTGGIAVLNKNDFNAALAKIVDLSEGYYLLAYTPSDDRFDGDFRKLEIKVKGDYKVYSRRGYYAREERAVSAPTTKQDQLLAAVKSPLARRDIDLDAMVLYKATPQNQGAIDISLVIDPKKLQFEEHDGKQTANVDVVGFVFDELGKLRGGFSETVNVALTPDEYKQAAKTGFTYAANTTLPPGVYQIRLAVHDNKNNSIGTLSRYLEVPDLTKGRLSASSLLLGAVPAKDMKATAPTPISGNRQISRKQDLRYAVIIYNAKQKDGKPQVTTQLVISQNGQEIFKGEEEAVTAGGSNAGQLIKVGQLGMAGVKPGRYTMTLIITDPLADKKAQTITRSMDFIVVN